VDGGGRAPTFSKNGGKAQCLRFKNTTFGEVRDYIRGWNSLYVNELYREAEEVERWNRLHRGEKPRSSHLQNCLGEKAGVVVAASDYVEALPSTLARWMPKNYVVLGTDGFGRSDGRKALREFFEVNAEHMAFGALSELAKEGKVDGKTLKKAQAEWKIDPERSSAIRS